MDLSQQFAYGRGSRDAPGPREAITRDGSVEYTPTPKRTIPPGEEWMVQFVLPNISKPRGPQS